MTETVLYMEGKAPSLKEIVASLVMSVAKMSGQSLMTEVGILSIGDDLAGMDLMSLRTLSAEGGVMAERGSDMCGLSANREFKGL